MKDFAILAGGCFWCTEAIFKNIKGVELVMPGYTGGQTAHPAYEEVSSGTTGHAEAIQIYYDSRIISYEKILEIFFLTHDPTQLKSQDHDRGTQYRSAIFYHDDYQKNIAKQVKARIIAEKIFSKPIVTEISKLDKFYEAEEYHRDYFTKNPEYPYYQAIISPKLAKMRNKFNSYLK